MSVRFEYHLVEIGEGAKLGRYLASIRLTIRNIFALRRSRSVGCEELEQETLSDWVHME